VSKKQEILFVFPLEKIWEWVDEDMGDVPSITQVLCQEVSPPLSEIDHSIKDILGTNRYVFLS
jgi:hypothetical protein